MSEQDILHPFGGFISSSLLLSKLEPSSPFGLIPASHCGKPSDVFDVIMHLPDVGFPLLPLPQYMASIFVRHGRKDNFFRSQIEYLIVGEEWCAMYLDGRERELVQERSTPRGKLTRTGSHPK
jgi:hypothetical protein